MDFFVTLWNEFLAMFGERVELGTNTVTTLNIIVWSLFIGFVIAIGITLYNKLVIGKIVRALIEKDALTPESACYAKEIGAASPLLRRALRKGGTLGRIVYSIDDGSETEAKCSCERRKYYIPEDNLHRAEVIYGKPAVGVLTILLAILAFFIVTLLAFILIPDMLQIFSNIGNMM